jgi:hypothetical protein
MANKQIIEDYKAGIPHSELAIFYCKESDNQVVRRLTIVEKERKLILFKFSSKRFPPDGYVLAVKRNGATIKRLLSKKE